MSKLEQMTYKMQPAGHEEPSPRRGHQEQNKDVAKAFEEFVTRWPIIWNEKEADQIVPKYKISLEEAHAYVFANQDHERIYLAGPFLSQVYMHVPEKEIIFDIKTQTNLGEHARMLPADKTFINFVPTMHCGSEAKGKIINYAGRLFHKGALYNLYVGGASSGIVINYGRADSIGAESTGLCLNYAKTENFSGLKSKGAMINLGTTGTNFAETASGLAINFCKAGMRFGKEASGIIINCGEADDGFGDEATGIVIALKNANGFGWVKDARLVLKEDDCKKVPELGNYLENLKDRFEQGRNDYKMALKVAEELGSKPAQKLKYDIEQILKGHGYNV